MSKSILMIVDVQRSLIEYNPYNKDKVISNIKDLISIARNNKIEVLYIRHDNGKNSNLEQGTDGWQIHDDVKPKINEVIFEKQYNSAFYKTNLNSYLKSKAIETIILVGLQTEYCIDATCKSGFEHGYKIIIPEETNTTFDNEYLSANKLYEFYNYKIWNNRFAKVIPFKDVVNIFPEIL